MSHPSYAESGLLLSVRRVVAYTFDVALLFAVLGGGQFVLSRAIGFPSWSALGESALLLEAWVLLTISLPSWVYFVASDRSARGATLGKRLMRLRVRSVDGAGIDSRISTPRALLRTAVKLLPWEITHLSLMLPVPVMLADEATILQWAGLLLADAAILVYLGVMLLTHGSRSVHDLVARTAVCDASGGVEHLKDKGRER